MERTKKRWAMTSGGLAAVALTAVVVLAGPASATDSSTAGSPAPSSSAASTDASATPKFCGHIEKALDRRQKLSDRWSGDESQHGSVAWLQARAAKVGAQHPELAKLLTDEAALRSQAKDPAATIIADLQAIRQARCGG